MFDTIVIAVDGSDSARNAVRTASTAFPDARLIVLNAPQAETTAFPTGAVAGYHEVLSAPSHEELMEAGRAIVAQAAGIARAEGREVETHVRIGDPVRHVLRLAGDEEADLIVMGRRGLGGVAGLLLGSISQKIQHHARCACLTVV